MTKIGIIGAPTSGLYLAYLLARKRVQVEVYEKEEKGQAAPRTLIVTSKLNEILEYDFSEAVINKIWRYELGAGGQPTRIDLDNPELVSERKNFLGNLAKQAEEAGDRIFWGNEVKEIKRLNEPFDLIKAGLYKTKKDLYEARIKAEDHKA